MQQLDRSSRAKFFRFLGWTKINTHFTKILLLKLIYTFLRLIEEYIISLEDFLYR